MKPCHCLEMRPTPRKPAIYAEIALPTIIYRIMSKLEIPAGHWTFSRQILDKTHFDMTFSPGKMCTSLPFKYYYIWTNFRNVQKKIHFGWTCSTKTLFPPLFCQPDFRIRTTFKGLLALSYPKSSHICFTSRSGSRLRSLLPPKYVTYILSLGTLYTLIIRSQAQ